jgi:hypothetical protein
MCLPEPNQRMRDPRSKIERVPAKSTWDGGFSHKNNANCAMITFVSQFHNILVLMYDIEQ